MVREYLGRGDSQRFSILFHLDKFPRTITEDKAYSKANNKENSTTSD